MSHCSIKVGSQLQALRKERGLSLQTVGKALGVTGSHISQVEKESISHPDNELPPLQPISIIDLPIGLREEG